MGMRSPTAPYHLSV
nr:unnamed protein product [Callosobruchus analis]